ncbi:peptidoglycan recognition family protein [Streptomyces sp. NPDC048384]|uniref:peptidoglycan recognition protein family protein n=1 Tax=Streptomyces sp. NPDC048384 TaxID=3155487 RepID=UPI003417DF21
MAPPLTAADFLTRLRAEGVTVVEVGSWRTHTRTSSSRPWGPVNGVIVHHTATPGGTARNVSVCRTGYEGLPGPLCHGVIGKDGVVYLVGYGRTNHAGGGDPAVLTQVIGESYGTAPSRPTKGNVDGVDGNARFYGFECENLGTGKDPWPAKQIEAIVRASSAVCRAHGWGPKSVIGHLEWSDDKPDPRGFTMPSIRDRVAERLKHAASWNPNTPTPPPVSTIETRVAALEKLVAAQGARIIALEKKVA